MWPSYLDSSSHHGCQQTHRHGNCLTLKHAKHFIFSCFKNMCTSLQSHLSKQKITVTLLCSVLQVYNQVEQLINCSLDGYLRLVQLDGYLHLVQLDGYLRLVQLDGYLRLVVTVSKKYQYRQI